MYISSLCIKIIIPAIVLLIAIVLLFIEGENNGIIGCPSLCQIISLFLFILLFGYGIGCLISLI